MPDRARKITSTGPMDVFAYNTTANDANKRISWKCINPRCNVNMTLYNAGTDKAYFASRWGEKGNHFGVGCILSNMVYDPHSYDETLFEKDAFFNGVLYAPVRTHRPKGTTTPPVTTHIEVNPQTPIRTIRELYQARLHYGISASINGVPFNDLIADEENFLSHSSGINGPLVVRAVAYWPIEPTRHIIFDYPRFIPYSSDFYHVAIHIPTKRTFKSLFEKLFPAGSTWKTRKHVLLCGDWTLGVVNGEEMPVCEFTRSTMQLHVLKYG